ncbi:hypothetical protein BD626DRAFT_537071 [Schizophyllum amplum]|uniref:Uncharacterized protein n=1 Tax=Schizophyllum amplum TaxID=97359 RepID=A0A550CE75_9AGAR|nr:hypothetical protein BD626DRAFT_537071 [Auriculariopsis ampla]
MTNSIIFPTQVAVLFKQFFRVFSGLAISNQYILHRQAGLDDGLALATVDPSDFGGGWSPQDATELEKRSCIFRAHRGRMVSFRPVENRRVHSSDRLQDSRVYGFDTRGPNAFPSMRMHYWANILQILREKMGAEVMITAVPPTGSISSRAEALHLQLKDKVRGRGLNPLAHSMGGLDARHLIPYIKPKEYSPLSLMSVRTRRVRKAENYKEEQLKQALRVAGLTEEQSIRQAEQSKGKDVKTAGGPSLSTFSTAVMSSPAYANLTTTYLNNVF